MAYEDIEMWRRIMEAEEAEEKAYDEACARNAEEAAELDEKEFWECGQKEIDPKTLGMVDENEADDYDVEKALRAARIPGVADVVVSAGKILVKGDGTTDMGSLAGEIQNALQDADWMDASVVYNDGLESTINGEPYTEYSFELDPYASDDYDDDYDEYDEDIDFSQYQLDEADMREPLTAASAALDRPASTADLNGQDSVRLMTEAVKFYGADQGAFSQLADYLKALDDGRFNGFQLFCVMKKNLGNKLNAAEGWAYPTDFENGTLTVDLLKRPATGGRLFDAFKHAGVKRLSDIREVKLARRDDLEYAGIEIDDEANQAAIVFDKTTTSNWKNKYGDMFADSEKESTDFLDEALEDLGNDGQLEDLEGAEEAIEKLERNDDIPLTDEDWKTVDGLQTLKDKIEFIQKKCEGAALTPSAQKELDATIEFLVGQSRSKIADASSRVALEEIKKFYRKWIEDPDFREKNGKQVDDPTGKPGPNGQKPKIFVTDPDSAAAKQFKELFDRLSDVDKEAFSSWAAQAKSRFVAKFKAPREWDRGGGMAGGIRNGRKQENGRRDMHGVDGDGDDAENPLAQHGFDQEVGAADLADVGGDPAAGDDMYIDVNQDKDWSIFSHDGIYKDIAGKTAIMAQQAGITKDELQKQLADEFKKRRIINTVLDKGRNEEDLTDYQVEYIFSELTPEQQEEFKQELVDSLPWPVWMDADGHQVPAGTPGAQEEPGDADKQRQFIEYLFRFGKNRRVTLQDLLKQYGIAGDQSGITGGGTEAGDALVLGLIAGMADYYGVDPDESKDLWAHKGTQSPSKADVARNVEPRRLVKYLAAKILQDLYDFHADHLFRGMRKEIPQGKPEDADLYREGPDGKMHKVTGKEVEGIKGKKWNDVQKALRDLLSTIFLKGAIGGTEADRSDATNLKRHLKDAIEKWNGTDKNKGERQARKLKHYLTPRELAELQSLVKKVRDGSMEEEDEMWRLCTLERMRFGFSEPTARQWVEEQLRSKTYRNAENALWLFTQKRAWTFLNGASGNMTRDGIKMDKPVYAQEPIDAAGVKPDGAEGEA